MRFFARFLVAATAITGALAQYDDGYQNVSTSTAPVQIRLAYQGPTAMMVSWNTFSQLSQPTVMYGLTSSSLNQVAYSTVSVTYATSLTYNNHVNITGLAPYTTYYYLPQYSNATTPYTFTTARAAGDTTPYTVGVVVDMGTFGALGLSTTTGASHPLAVNEQTTIAALTEMVSDYEFLVHAGDIAYADYWLKEEIQSYLPNTTIAQGAAVYEHILNAFFDEMVGLTSAKAYMVNAGNHEANCDNGKQTNSATGQTYTAAICSTGQTNFTGYMNHWRMPSGPSGGLGNFWYSYDYGMTHFVHIDTETDLGNSLVGPDEGSPEYGGPFGTYNQQINWLTADLAAVNRTLTPWVVVFGHRGWYLSVSGSICANCKTAFETLLYTYGVDLYLNGHAHVYERTVPIYQNVIDPNGLNNPSAPLYVTNGAAGHYDGLDTFTTIQSYSAYHENADYAWSTLTFLNRTHMVIDTLWSANNSVFDTATLYKAHVFSTNTSTTTTTTVSTTSTSSSSGSSSTSPTTTTNTATTTTSGATYSTYTNFNGQGHLYVFAMGVLDGNIGSAGTWYVNSSSVATYTAVPVVSNNTLFYLQHSSTYCTIGSDYSFACAATSSSAATIFGQTSDGNLTYNGNEAFYASSSAVGLSSSTVRPNVYATSLPVSLNIAWTTPGTTTATTTTSSSTTTNSSTSVTSTTSTNSSTSATSMSTTTTTASNSTTTTTTTAANSTSTAAGATVTVTTTTTSPSTTTKTTTIVSSTTATQTITSPTTLTQTTTETDSTTLTQTTTSPTTLTQTATETDSTTFTQTTTSPTTLTQITTETDSTTLTQTTTETESTTFTQTLTTPTTTTQTVNKPTTTTETTTETDSTTQTQTTTETDTTTYTQPASTVTVTQPASTVTVTSTPPASTKTVTSTLPASTVTHTVTATKSATTTYISTTTTAKTATVTSKVTSTVSATKTVFSTLTSTASATRTITSTATSTASATKTVTQKTTATVTATKTVTSA